MALLEPILTTIKVLRKIIPMRSLAIHRTTGQKKRHFVEFFVELRTTELEDTVRCTNDGSARSTDKRTEVEEDEDSRKQPNKEFHFIVVDVILGHNDSSVVLVLYTSD